MKQDDLFLGDPDEASRALANIDGMLDELRVQEAQLLKKARSQKRGPTLRPLSTRKKSRRAVRRARRETRARRSNG